jgi:hypothetical protein
MAKQQELFFLWLGRPCYKKSSLDLPSCLFKPSDLLQMQSVHPVIEGAPLSQLKLQKIGVPIAFKASRETLSFNIYLRMLETVA